jgi:hypothetical protein
LQAEIDSFGEILSADQAIPGLQKVEISDGVEVPHDAEVPGKDKRGLQPVHGPGRN